MAYGLTNISSGTSIKIGEVTSKNKSNNKNYKLCTENEQLLNLNDYPELSVLPRKYYYAIGYDLSMLKKASTKYLTISCKGSNGEKIVFNRIYKNQMRDELYAIGTRTEKDENGNDIGVSLFLAYNLDGTEWKGQFLITLPLENNQSSSDYKYTIFGTDSYLILMVADLFNTETILYTINTSFSINNEIEFIVTEFFITSDNSRIKFSQGAVGYNGEKWLFVFVKESDTVNYTQIGYLSNNSNLYSSYTTYTYTGIKNNIYGLTNNLYYFNNKWYLFNQGKGSSESEVYYLLGNEWIKMNRPDSNSFDNKCYIINDKMFIIMKYLNGESYKVVMSDDGINFKEYLSGNQYGLYMSVSYINGNYWLENYHFDSNNHENSYSEWTCKKADNSVMIISDISVNTNNQGYIYCFNRLVSYPAGGMYDNSTEIVIDSNCVSVPKYAQNFYLRIK